MKINGNNGIKYIRMHLLGVYFCPAKRWNKNSLLTHSNSQNLNNSFFWSVFLFEFLLLSSSHSSQHSDGYVFGARVTTASQRRGYVVVLVITGRQSCRTGPVAVLAVLLCVVRRVRGVMAAARTLWWSGLLLSIRRRIIEMIRVLRRPSKAARLCRGRTCWRGTRWRLGRVTPKPVTFRPIAILCTTLDANEKRHCKCQHDNNDADWDDDGCGVVVAENVDAVVTVAVVVVLSDVISVTAVWQGGCCSVAVSSGALDPEVVQRNGMLTFRRRTISGDNLLDEVVGGIRHWQRLICDDRIVETLFSLFSEMFEHLWNKEKITVALPRVAREIEAAQVTPRHKGLRKMTQFVVSQIEMTQRGNCVKCVRCYACQSFVEWDCDELEVDASGECVRSDVRQSAASGNVKRVEFRQEPERVRLDRIEMISSDVQASKSSHVSERVWRDVGEIVVGQFETSKRSKSAESRFVDVTDLTWGQVEKSQRSERQERVAGNDRQRVARQVELGEWGDASKRFGGNEVQEVVFET